VIFAGPQAHVVFTCCSVVHGASEAFSGAFALCPFASAKPTDMAVASNTMTNVLSMVSSSLKLGSETYLKQPEPFMNGFGCLTVFSVGISWSRAAAVLLCLPTN
jgi:hypothetical protein